MTPRVVLDASAALHLIMDGTDAEAIGGRLDEVQLVAAPDLFASEVANGLWKYVGRGDLTSADAASRLEEALALTGSLVPGRLLAHEALVAASTYRHSVYDMMYAVLARRQGAAVVTMDVKLTHVLRSMRVEVYCPLERDPVS